ncbi:hypothetical protein FB567DRAFT_268347 [Paraphoma chrysanthemicola]|uniref:Ankyrin repeat protein n=1 Tax=Paraphoma chrysanthemicola TaxID=798071 RepID=A0A8K0REW5_9PLEO|nr:hypothetical protein FB567DRAFT_268347 [Paraphoma chrysanthemicola]
MKGALALIESPELALAERACLTNNPAFLEQALSQTADDDLYFIHDRTRAHAVRNNATAVLDKLVELGVSFADVSSKDAWGGGQTSTATLEFLLAHGWDINKRAEYSTEAQPLMWFTVRNIEMVKWCLEHGASVHPRDMEPIQDNVITQSQRSCEQILEHVVATGDIATFELLRGKGASLGWRCLHRAVEQAAHSDPAREDAATAAAYDKRMAMVLHLLDVVKLDVNAPDQPVDAKVPNRLGTPICYIPGSGTSVEDTRELTWLLLDRGADPTPALKIAQDEYPQFIEDVKAWRARKGDSNKCCIQ